MNRVELQNGCLALGHANIFIPSTLCGSNVDTKTGKVDRQRFMENMDKEADVYISRVDGSPCGETTINLFKGADSTSNQELRARLLQYLKGSKVFKRKLQESDPQMYDFIDRIWQIRNDHMVEDLPPQYIFISSAVSSLAASTLCVKNASPQIYLCGTQMVHQSVQILCRCQYLIHSVLGGVQTALLVRQFVKGIF